MKTQLEKEFENRESEIRKELRFLFNSNMKITDWDVPETNNKKAAQALYKIILDELKLIKEDIEAGKFD